MDAPGPHDTPGRVPHGARTGPDDRRPSARPAPPGQPGVIGIALAAVLAFVLAQGSWEWFSAYLGGTLLVLVLAFTRLPPRTPGPGSPYARSLVAFALIVGLCAALVLAPALQRWAWLFPMPGTRAVCPSLGAYAADRAEAALGPLADRDRTALARAREAGREEAVADCLAATTTRWLPVYGAGAAVLAGAGGWALGRARAGRAADDGSGGGTESGVV
ncbi:hypothetical protein JNUCC64_28755 [Streptomyces sp. JNUCC 64]